MLNKNESPRKLYRLAIGIILAATILSGLFYAIANDNTTREAVVVLIWTFSVMGLWGIALYYWLCIQSVTMNDTYVKRRGLLFVRRISYEKIEAITLSRIVYHGGYGGITRGKDRKGQPLTTIAAFDELRHANFLERCDSPALRTDDEVLFYFHFYSTDFAILLEKTTAPVFIAERVWEQHKQELRELLAPYRFRVFIAPYHKEYPCGEEKIDFVPLSSWE